MRLAHRFGDGQDEANPFESEDGGSVSASATGMSANYVLSDSVRTGNGPDQEREVLRVEELDVGDASLREEGDLVRKDVDQPDDDEDVGDERCSGQLLDVADQGKRCETVPSALGFFRKGEELTQEDDGLRRDEERNRDVGPAVRDGQEERLQILRLSVRRA